MEESETKVDLAADEVGAGEGRADWDAPVRSAVEVGGDVRDDSVSPASDEKTKGGSTEESDDGPPDMAARFILSGFGRRPEGAETARVRASAAGR